MPKARPHPSKVYKKSARSKHMKMMNEARWAAIAAQKEQQPLPSTSYGVGTSKSPDNVDCLPELEREVDKTAKSISELLLGRRVVNLGYVLHQYKNIATHSQICTMGRMDFVKESRVGLKSELIFYCDNCDKRCTIYTDKPTEEHDINQCAVWSSISIGIGHHQCQELLAVINIPFMTQKTFAKITENVKKIWEDQLHLEMKKAGEEEKRIALEKGNVTADGTPHIKVIVDGGWSKRSYGHGYNAASGVGVIIGAETKKLLFLGVRNKTCSSCAYGKKKGIVPKKHTCALNFSGPSTSMEQDIIVQGFNDSMEQHGLMYKYLIGDGDSSVYARIVERVPYGRQVIKIECANHMTRCVSDKLHKLSKNTLYPVESRKLLLAKTNNISRLERLVKGIRTAIKNNKNDAQTLRQELSNAPYHVFGKHVKCRNTFCDKQTVTDEDVTTKINEKFFYEIRKTVEPLINKADCLAFNSTTNQAERYMALVAKCTGGKRVNYTRRQSYTTRAYAAGLSHLYGPGWHLPLFGTSAGTITRKIFDRRQEMSMKRKLSSSTRKRCVKSDFTGPDMHYGPNAAVADINDMEMSKRQEEFLLKLQTRVSSHEKVMEIETSTRGQHDNVFWKEMRTDYLTASNFGTVIKRKQNTPCHNLVKRLLYCKGDIKTPGILYGRTNEAKAIEKYQLLLGKEVSRCGLFVSRDHPFLAASPDGVVDDGLIEVKCLQSVPGKLKDFEKNTKCYSIVDGEIKLRKNHNYFYQVQGQLNVANKKFCDFILYCENDFHVERIERDKDLWETVMVPKLEYFYKNCILPELIDPRVPRGLHVRDPT